MTIRTSQISPSHVLRSTRQEQEKPIIGWAEYVDLPEWSISGLRAKIDTGAQTSALHVDTIERLTEDKIRFSVILRRRPLRRVQVDARVVRRGRVRASTGVTTMRFFVRTRLRLGPVERTIELSLVDRRGMIFRMLLGREALAGAFLIDVNRRFLQGKRKSSGKKKKPQPQEKNKG